MAEEFAYKGGFTYTIDGCLEEGLCSLESISLIGKNHYQLIVPDNMINSEITINF